MTAPTVSVIMAAYDGARLLPATLESLAAQTFADWELVVVDDRSTDGTWELLRGWPDPRVRAIRAEANGGPVRARNIAFAAARGRYLAALDHDDLCRPERFARQVAHLDADPEIVALGTAAALLVDGAVRPTDYAALTSPALIEWLLLIENPLVWSSMMLRADAVRRLDGPTRPELLYAEDFDLHHRLAGLGRVARLDEVLVDYRVHAGGLSKRFADAMRGSAARVLADAHRPVFGERADRAAELIGRHLLLRETVPDRETLAELGEVIAAAQAAFVAARAPGREDLKLIRWETARRWARVGRAGLRSGALTVADLLAVRPEHLGLGYAGLDALALSGAVGAARRARQILAA